MAVGGLLGVTVAVSVLERIEAPLLLRVITAARVPLLLAVAPLSRWPIATVPVALMIVASPAINAALLGHLAHIVPARCAGA